MASGVRLLHPCLVRRINGITVGNAGSRAAPPSRCLSCTLVLFQVQGQGGALGDQSSWHTRPESPAPSSPTFPAFSGFPWLPYRLCLSHSDCSTRMVTGWEKGKWVYAWPQRVGRRMSCFGALGPGSAPECVGWRQWKHKHGMTTSKHWVPSKPGKAPL